MKWLPAHRGGAGVDGEVNAMRALFRLLSLFAPLLLGIGSLAAGSARADENIGKNKARCASYGFKEGTDAFANCVMKLSREDRKRSADRETLLRRYRDFSIARRGNDRYPVCSAAMMENELDTSIGNWVGPNCQMAPD